MSNTPNKTYTPQKIFKLAIKLYLAIFIVVILVWGINLAWHMFDLYRLAKNLQNDPGQITTKNSVAWVESASGDIGTIYNQLNPLFPVFNALQKIPWVGPYLGQVDPLLSFTNSLSQAGKEIALGLSPLLDQPPPNLSSMSFPERLSQALQDGQPHFVLAGQYFDLASQVRNRINADLLPESLQPMYEKLDTNYTLFEAGVQLLQSAPSLLGSGHSQTYLVLAQNRDELRATGGFISGIGLVTLQNGKINQFSLGDSYAVDDFTKPYPTPPEALHRFMLADYWLTRDANWSPDFPTSARQVQELYTLSTGNETQGVIAFNQLLIKGVLQVIGPIQVPGTDEPISADNVENYMRQAWAPEPQQGLSGEWWLHRKDFMQQLGNVIIEKALTISDQQQLLGLLSSITHLIDQGQLLIYMNDPTAQSVLAKAHWDGAMQPGAGDYLYLVDSNVGFNKVDSLVTRSIDYYVDLSDINHPTGRVTLSYQNTGSGNTPCKQVASYGTGTYLDMQLRCYWDYWRLYTPTGTVLEDSDAQPVAAEMLLNGQSWSGQVEKCSGEAGTQCFAGLLVLPQSQSSQIQISYSLPQSVLQTLNKDYFSYSLSVQVQPGLNGLPFRLIIKPPDRARINNPGAGWSPESGNIWVWQGSLSQWIQYKLTYETTP